MIVTNIISSIIALVAIITLCWQFYSNKQQKFEDKFFELLKIHRQNVNEMKIGTLEKRVVFKELFYELCNCQIFIEKIFEDFKNKYYRTDENKEQHDFYYNFGRKEKLNLAFQLFFYGSEFNHIFKIIYPNENIQQTEKLVIEDKIKEKIREQNEKWKQGNFSIVEIVTDNEDNNFSFYKPYCGHSEWLGHYFRHLYHTVKFIDKECLCFSKKYEYLKILKAQLSEYEQAILFYHACSDLGSAWFKKGKNSFIVKYRLIQNLPLLIVFGENHGEVERKLSDLGLSKEEVKEYFKWEQ
ncbi:MAG: putative phage abortive infection protein [Candidatus Symbiothrix sp.]|jgi:hypothetical protein|nr:putative phage abortive infection protein [Candidatus Symbiothrix sp.]